jgi:hypothetical protein
MRFWDASAVVPLLLNEPGRKEMLALAEQDPTLLTWWGTPIECVSAIARREREGALAASDTAEALTRLRMMSESWQEVLPTEPVRGMAQRLLRVHALRAADALQLAAAVVASEHEPATLGFVCLDDRLAEAAAREGFTVLAGATARP